MKNQNNGNVQLNSERESINNRINSLQIIGNSKRVLWAQKRRFRSI